jgi:hypothetical protein
VHRTHYSTAPKAQRADKIANLAPHDVDFRSELTRDFH